MEAKVGRKRKYLIVRESYYLGNNAMKTLPPQVKTVLTRLFVSRKGSTNLFPVFCALLCTLGVTPTVGFATTNEPVQMLVPHGQTRSSPFLVYLDRDITPASSPALILRATHVFRNHGCEELFTNKCSFLARNQQYSDDAGKVPLTKTGTLMLVDLNPELDVPWYEPAIRVRSCLQWFEPGLDGKMQELHTAGGDGEVYLGNNIGATLWTCVVMAAIIGVILVACRIAKGSALPLICSPDGTVSLWRFQLLAWTFAVGSIVVCLGLTRLHVPTIPESLIALMGMSVATGGLGYIGNGEHLQPNTASAAVQTKKTFKGGLSELLSDSSGNISVAQSQMLFWTLTMLLLFLVKSYELRAVWEVPWTMVALMGVSQAGYLGPKFAPAGQPGNPKPAN
jgi:hypothetical protein